MKTQKMILTHEAPVPTDAGSKARAKLETKRNNRAKVIKLYLWTIALTVLIVPLLLAYKQYTVKGYHYERKCVIPTDSGLNVTGKRRYLNQSLNVFGMSFIDATKADESTTIDSTTQGLNVVGITGDEWWSINNPVGEPTMLKLKKADTYIFTQNGKSYVTSYEGFCR